MITVKDFQKANEFPRALQGTTAAPARRRGGRHHA